MDLSAVERIGLLVVRPGALLMTTPVFGATLLGFARGRAEDRQVAINLRAVGIDDHAVRPPGESERKCRLAAGRRSSN